MIVDTGDEVYCWIGRDASREEKEKTFQHASVSLKKEKWEARVNRLPEPSSNEMTDTPNIKEILHPQGSFILMPRDLSQSDLEKKCSNSSFLKDDSH